MDSMVSGGSGASGRPRLAGLSFRARLVLGVCGLVLVTGAAVLWLAHRSARNSTEALTESVFREVSSRAATHARAFVLRAAPVVESLGQLADKGLEIEDPDRLAPQLLAVLKANPGLSWVSYGDESGRFTGAFRAPDGGMRVTLSRIVNGKTEQVEYDVLRDDGLKRSRFDPTADTIRGNARFTRGRSKPADSFGCRRTSSMASGSPALPARCRSRTGREFSMAF